MRYVVSGTLGNLWELIVVAPCILVHWCAYAVRCCVSMLTFFILSTLSTITITFCHFTPMYPPSLMRKPLPLCCHWSARLLSPSPPHTPPTPFLHSCCLVTSVCPGNWLTLTSSDCTVTMDGCYFPWGMSQTRPSCVHAWMLLLNRTGIIPTACLPYQCHGHHPRLQCWTHLGDSCTTFPACLGCYITCLLRYICSSRHQNKV